MNNFYKGTGLIIGGALLGIGLQATSLPLWLAIGIAVVVIVIGFCLQMYGAFREYVLLEKMGREITEKCDALKKITEEYRNQKKPKK